MFPATGVQGAQDAAASRAYGRLQVVDVSGELRGDLRAQQREMVHVNIADMDANEAGQNTALTWGVVARDGLAYVNDINSGLWIVRMLPRTPPAMHP